MSDIITDRAITLTEPWATLMAIGAKRNETRSKPTRFRGWLAIHAAKGWPASCRDLSATEPFLSALTRLSGYHALSTTLGHVIAVAHVVDCHPTEKVHLGASGGFPLTEHESAFGDYGPGRFYYVTDHVRRLRKPLPARGFQSIPWRLPTPITEDMLL